MNLKYYLCTIMIFGVVTTAQAGIKYSPSDVFTGVKYANFLVSKILSTKNIVDISVPTSREKAAKPMHVYELHVSVLSELYQYALKNNRPPPPLAISSPIKYSPTDVYYLTQLVKNNLEEIYKDMGGSLDFGALKQYSGKSPTEVYQELFKLYYQLNLLNDKTKVSPSEVYSHIYRAKEDLQNTLRVLSKRLDRKKEKQKRLLITAIYGMHPDGSLLSSLEQGKNPGDVQDMAFKIRAKLNVLRKKNQLAEIQSPALSDFSGKVKPIDVFLQAQFIVAELNLLKSPLKVSSMTNMAKPVKGKSPSDVFQEMKHINYMLDRIIKVL